MRKTLRWIGTLVVVTTIMFAAMVAAGGALARAGASSVNGTGINMPYPTPDPHP
jgi:hypothetical protein